MSPTTILSKPFRKDERGRNVSIADQIVEYVTAGNYLETAAAACGVNRTNLLKLLARGGKALRAHAAKPDRPIPAGEKVFARFAERVAQATAIAEIRDVATVDMLASGGLEIREITIEYAVDGDTRTEIKRSEHVRTLAPSARAAMWRLERRNPAHWGRPGSHVALSEAGAPLPSREERLANLSAAIDDYQTGYDDGLAAANAVEVET